MSENNAETPAEQTPVATPEMSRKDALLGSLHAVKECQSLIKNGHYVGSRARKILMCLDYLGHLEDQIKAQIQLEK